MKRVGALLLLGAALLLASGGDCEICSAVRDDVNLFLTGSTEDYVDNVARYQSSPVILENAKILKECIDGKMTQDDKQDALSVLDKIYASNLC
ncbi:Major allergen I polypeptide chain 1 [Vulpes lagopus]|uniref:major allergen I polypeptide chain 1-like isoform X1 n=1 Tax=Vulpes lagopus TaxID=494514 RepID=UPI001BC92A18|nr:major allergen I polypeptide chain 1-like isoform X1 [Vulpes lagopus]